MQARRAARAQAGATSLATAIALLFSVDVSAQTALPSMTFADDAFRNAVVLRSNPYLAVPTSAKPTRAVPPMGANVLYSETFDVDCSQDPPAPPPSPPAPYPSPLGWTVHNVDNRTPAANVAYVTNAWIVREDFANNVGDCTMFSTSWYTPAGAADDWAVIPFQVTPELGTELRWNALTYDADYRDGYEVRYSTTGTAPADFLANPPLFSTPAEEVTWQARTQSLAALAGTPIHLAFRNNSNDKFLLLLDDFVIETVTDFDPALDALGLLGDSAGYARIPFGLGFGYEVDADVSNLGGQGLTNVVVNAEVTADASVVASPSSTAIPALAAGASQTVALTSGTFTRLGEWAVSGEVQATEGDQNPANSTANAVIGLVTADELSRSDWGTITGGLGIGAEVGGELGQDFTLTQTATLLAVRIAMNNPDVIPDNPDPDPDGDGVGELNGYTLEATVRAWDTGTDTPGALLFTGTVVIPVDAAVGAMVLDFPIPDGLELAPGRYLIAAVEPVLPEPRTLSVLQTNDRFTAGTTWVNWPGTPLGGWGNNEDFGASFAKPYVMSAVFASDFIFVDSFDGP